MDEQGARLRRRRVSAAIAVCLAIVAGTLLSELSARQNAPAGQIAATVSVPEQKISGMAAEALDRLVIKGRAPKTGYSRARFGSGWAEFDSCDTRNIILKRDLVQTVIGDDGCTVMSGYLSDKYTGKKIEFTRGSGTSSAVQIDHVVALSDSWQKGAQQFSPERRELFANDPLNLLAVDGLANMKKGGSDAASWLPPNKAYRCRYVARQIAVKAKYLLWVTQAEFNAMRQILSGCPGQPLPA